MFCFFLATLRFEGLVGAVAFDGFIKINQIAVKVRSIDAGKLRFTANSDAAATAHTRSVNHEGAHADHAGNVILLGHEGRKLHHGKGPNGKDLIELDAAFDEFFELIGDKAMVAEGTIIGTGMKIGTGCFHFILENDTFFISESSNEINLVASLMKTAGNRQGNGAAKTAA